MNKHLPGCLPFQRLGVVGCVCVCCCCHCLSHLYSMLNVTVYFHISEIMHRAVGDIFHFSRSCAARYWSYFWVVKEGLKRWKKLYFLIANWYIAKAIIFSNILNNSHSISGLLINGIFHILIHWVKDTDFQKLNFCLRCLWIFVTFAFNSSHWRTDGWVCSIPEHSLLYDVLWRSVTGHADLPPHENILWHLCPGFAMNLLF